MVSVFIIGMVSASIYLTNKGYAADRKSLKQLYKMKRKIEGAK